MQEQVTDLVARWNTIQQAADDRNQALERTMAAAKLFHDQLEPFLEWLEAAEKDAQAHEVQPISAPHVLANHNALPLLSFQPIRERFSFLGVVQS